MVLVPLLLTFIVSSGGVGGWGGEGPGFQRGLEREKIFWNFSGGTKRGIQCLVVVQWEELVKAGQFFLNEL